MKKAYDCGAKKLWVVNVGDIKPAGMNIEYFMQMAWDISVWDHQNSDEFVTRWAAREFGSELATNISDIMRKNYELGYALASSLRGKGICGKQRVHFHRGGTLLPEKPPCN